MEGTISGARAAYLRLLLAAFLLFAARTAHAQDFTSGLVGHWKLDETSGTTANDSGSGNNDGTLTNMEAGDWQPGNLGNGLVFDGTNEFVTMGDVNALDGLSAITVAAWVNTSDSSEQHLINKENGAGTIGPFVLLLGYPSAGLPLFAVYTPSVNWAVGSTPINDGQWHHVVGVYDGSYIRIYVDGVEKNSTAETGAMTSSSLHLALGAANVGFGGEIYHLNGSLDDARVYNRALSAEDVVALYENWQPGRLRYNTNWRTAEYFDGNRWIGTGKKTYVPNGVFFEGAEQLTSTANLTGVADGKLATASFWFRRNGGTGAQRIIWASNNTGTASDTNSRFRIEFATDNRLQIIGRSSAPADVFAIKSSTQFTDSNWHHVMFSFDLTSGTARHLYIDGASNVNGTPTTHTNTNVDFSMATPRNSVGARHNGNNPYSGDLADFWLDIGRYVDLSQASNREKFYKSGPVYLETNGSAPFGSAPEVFLSGKSSAWPTNKGTGGGFTASDVLSASIGPGGNASMILTGGVSSVTNGEQIALSGDYAFVVDGAGDSVRSFNISNPAAPTLSDTLTDGMLSDAFGIRIQGDYAYVPAFVANRLTVVDISDPTDMSVVGSVQDNTNLAQAFSVAVQGDYAYVTTRTTDRVTVVDVSNPAAPTVVGSILDSTYLDDNIGIVVSGNYVYVTGYNTNRLTAVNVSNPASPTVAGSIVDADLSGGYPFPAISGNFVYVPAGAARNLTIVDVSNPAAPSKRGTVDDSQLLLDATEVALAGDRAFVTAFGTDRVTEVDISNPSAPAIVNSITHANLDGANFIAVQGDYAYMTAYYGVRLNVIDIGGDRCANPSRKYGSIVYNTTENVMQFCNGEDWVRMGPQGAGGAGCSDPARGEGAMVFNSAAGWMQYCDGANWTKIGGVGAMATTAGLVGYWKFDETSGTTVQNSVSGGNDGTWNGSASVVSVGGKIDTAFEFNNAAHDVSVADYAALDISGTAITMAAWVYPYDLSQGDDAIMGKSWDGTFTSPYYQYGLEIDSNGTDSFVVYFGSPGGGLSADTFTSYTALQDEWQHVVVTYDGANVSLYINGELKQSISETDSIEARGNTFRIGADFRTPGAQEFNGRLDDVRVYNRPLTAAEIYNLYRATGGN